MEGYKYHDFLHVFYHGKNVGTNLKFNKKTHVTLRFMKWFHVNTCYTLRFNVSIFCLFASFCKEAYFVFTMEL